MSLPTRIAEAVEASVSIENLFAYPVKWASKGIFFQETFPRTSHARLRRWWRKMERNVWGRVLSRIHLIARSTIKIKVLGTEWNKSRNLPWRPRSKDIFLALPTYILLTKVHMHNVCKRRWFSENVRMDPRQKASNPTRRNGTFPAIIEIQVPGRWERGNSPELWTGSSLLLMWRWNVYLCS